MNRRKFAFVFTTTFLFASILVCNWSFCLAESDSAKLARFVETYKSNPTGIKQTTLRPSIEESVDSNLAKKLNYFELVALYQSQLNQLKSWFPNVKFSYSGSSVLRPCFGRRTMRQFFVLANPLQLISAPVFQSKNLVYKSLEFPIGDKILPGLQLQTSFSRQLVEQYPKPIYDLLYLADINARVFGFSNAQLVLKLSQNVIPAKVFEYNGPQQWKAHQRYKREDQTTSAITLTNYGHSSRKTFYFVSEHPDFAVEAKNFDKQDVLLTFFLWNNPMLASNSSPQPADRLPDFIYQIKIIAPK